jgi:hypothetical protein
MGYPSRRIDARPADARAAQLYSGRRDMSGRLTGGVRLDEQGVRRPKGTALTTGGPGVGLLSGDGRMSDEAWRDQFRPRLSAEVAPRRSVVPDVVGRSNPATPASETGAGRFRSIAGTAAMPTAADEAGVAGFPSHRAPLHSRVADPVARAKLAENRAKAAPKPGEPGYVRRQWGELAATTGTSVSPGDVPMLRRRFVEMDRAAKAGGPVASTGTDASGFPVRRVQGQYGSGVATRGAVRPTGAVIASRAPVRRTFPAPAFP